jgi:5-methylthioribose kinase
VRVVGESFPMALERSLIEAEVLKIEAQYCPDQVPTVYHADSEMYLIIMEDLRDHVIMREGMMTQVEYPKFAEHIGTFMAKTLFYTSDLYLNHETKKQRMAERINPALCKITEDLVFTDPYKEDPGNQWNAELNPQVEEIRANNALRARFYMLKEEFMTKGEALIHGDLHTGSIMINQDETKVIDPEFGFYGPMAFDPGLLMANFALSYCSQEYHAKDDAHRAAYRQWITDTMRDSWNVFEREFLKLWATKLNDQWQTNEFRDAYMSRLVKYTAGYAAAECMRRCLGLAHVPDNESIPDPKDRAVSESMALNVGQAWIMNYEKVTGIEDIIQMVVNAKPSYPYS